MGQPLASQHANRPSGHEESGAAGSGDLNDNAAGELNSLNAQAERCRRLAQATYNREVSEALGSMAEGFEKSAAQLGKKQAD